MVRRKIKKRKFKNTYSLQSIINKEIKYNHLSESFSTELLKYAEKTAKKEISHHEDFTHLPFVTIDGKFSKDFDDAVYVKVNSKDIDIYVAIADVSYFIRKDDVIDVEAKKRANSFYFPDRVLPMLPEIISNDICSLIPNKNRACLMVRSNIDSNGKVNFCEIKRVRIRSIARLNYEDVENYINKKKEFSKNIGNLINDLYKVFKILKNKSKLRFKLNFNPETFYIDTQGSKFKIKKNTPMISEKIIEELMIHTNTTVAKFILSEKINSNFRNHDEPTNEKINRLSLFCNQNSIHFSPQKKILQKDIFNIFDENKIDSKIFIDFILKSQSKASYNIKNRGHFGLALNEYTHFTSPIRRYSDLMVHRDILRHIYKEEETTKEGWICDHLTDQEKKSEKIERNILSKACCLILKKQKKKTYTGHIDGFIETGVFVKAYELPFYAFQRFDSMKDDFYILDETEQFAVGKKNGFLFKLGQKVSFKLKVVNSSNGKILINGLKKRENDKAS